MAREPIPTTTVGKNYIKNLAGATSADSAILHHFLKGVRWPVWSAGWGRLAHHKLDHLHCGGMLVAWTGERGVVGLVNLHHLARHLDVLNQLGVRLGVDGRLTHHGSGPLSQYFYHDQLVALNRPFIICGPLTLLAYRTNGKTGKPE